MSGFHHGQGARQYTDLQLDNAEEGNPFGFYTYEALQVKVTKRFSNGLTFLTGYAWAKTLTNADGAYPPEGGWNNQNQAGVQKWFVLSYSYELPFGKGKALLNQGGVANAIVGGWKVAAVQTYESGTPISINCAGDYTSGLFNPSCRVNVVSGVSTSYANTSSNYGNTYAFNPAAFSEPANYTLGNASRITNIYERPILNEDISLQKTVSFLEEVNVFWSEISSFRMGLS